MQRTARLLRLRPFEYLCLFLIGVALQAAVYFVRPTAAMQIMSEAIAIPILVGFATLRASVDLTCEEAPFGRIVTTLVERLWAIMLIEFAIIYFVGVGTALVMVGPIGGVLMGFLVLLFTGPLVLSVVYAATARDVSSLRLLPFALMRGIMLFWQSANFLRVSTIIYAIMLVNVLELGLGLGMHSRHVGGWEFWSNNPIDAFISIPLAIFAAVLYFDCVARERKLFERS